MASLSLNSPPSSAPSPERRMVFGIYIDPDFEKLLESSKTINTLIKNEYKIGNNKSGASSTASTYLLPNGKRYIVRKTPGGLQHGLRLRREIETYRILKMDPLYKQFVSNLVYADAHLAAGSKKSYFIFEHEDGAPLDEFIEKNKNTMTAEQVLTIYNYLQKAIDFLESSKVVHRDIKPENIYFSYKRGIPLLFDFDAGCIGVECSSVEFTGSPKYATPGSKTVRGQEGFTVDTKIYKYSPTYDRYSLAVILKEDLINLVRPSEKAEIERIGREEMGKFLRLNTSVQNKKGGNRMRRNKTRKVRGGSDCRVAIGFPKFGGKNKPTNIANSLLNLSECLISGGGCGCGSIKPMMKLPEGVSLGPITSNLMKGGGCPCMEVAPIPRPLGGYRATKRNLKYLKLWKKGKSIGFTMRSSLKAKGLIPRANGKKRVSAKYHR